MCKPKKPKAPEVKDPVYVRNSYLDGSRSPLFSQRGGRNSLRNPLGGNGLNIQRGVGIAPTAPASPGAGTPSPQGLDAIHAVFRR